MEGNKITSNTHKLVAQLGIPEESQGSAQFAAYSVKRESPTRTQNINTRIDTLSEQESQTSLCSARVLDEDTSTTLTRLLPSGPKKARYDAPPKFTCTLTHDDLQKKNGTSPWYEFSLKQDGVIQVCLRWHSDDDGEFKLFPVARIRTSQTDTKIFKPIIFLEEVKPEDCPIPSKKIIHLEGEFPSKPSKELLSELQVELQLINDENQQIANSTFIKFNEPAPLFEGKTPTGIDLFEMGNHHASEHRDVYSTYYDKDISYADIKPLDDCSKCLEINRETTKYKQWCKDVTQYMKELSQPLTLKVLMKHEALSKIP